MKHHFANKRGGLRIVIGICCVMIFCISAYSVFSQLIREKREAEAFDALIEQIGQEEPADSSEPAETMGSASVPTPELSAVEVDFDKYDTLYEQNHDLFGWVSIDGTELNYPVMHTPDDPERYLHLAFDGTYSSSGVPFLDGKCHPNCGNYIVYGHHMKNGSMFATLPEYADETFWREHPTINFDTIDKPGEYRVLAAFYAEVYDVGDKNVFRYYDYTDLTDEETFDEYLSGVYKAALYDTGVTAAYGDQLLTLITCSYHTEDGRFVVVAKEVS